MYNATYSGVDRILGIEAEDCLFEAQRTGGIFPGRPVVRPGLHFGPSLRKENEKICRNAYTKSDSYSPGIFTIQCVCRHQNLLCVSVMMEIECISTELSVLLPKVC